MPIALVRIDDRLVHGQVVEGWIPFLRAEEVAVISDDVAADETQSLLMRIALPEGVQLTVLRVADAPAFLRAAQDRPQRVLVLAPGPRQVLEVLKLGASLAKLNVGGLHYSAGRLALGKAIFLSREDREALSELGRRGVTIEGRAVPGDHEADILRLIDDARAEGRS